MWHRIRKVLACRTRAPTGLLLRFRVPVFVAMLVLAVLLGAAWAWAAFAAGLAVFGTELAVDADWQRPHRVLTNQEK